jgi:glutaredoxin
MLLTLYSKPDCHLCDEAKAVLKKFQKEFGFTFKEINIEEESQVFEKYRYEIPVVLLDGVKLFKGRIDEGKLRKALKSRL